MRHRATRYRGARTRVAPCAVGGAVEDALPHQGGLRPPASKQVGHERLDHGGKGEAGLDNVTAGGQLLDLFLGETDVDEALAALLAVAVALGSDGGGHADPITRRRLTEGYR